MKIVLDESLDKLYFDFFWGKYLWILPVQVLLKYQFVLLPHSISSKCFSVFLNNGTFSVWGLPNLFLFFICIIELERPRLVRKCDDWLIFSANECFMLSIFFMLICCCSHVHLIIYVGPDEVGCWTYHYNHTQYRKKVIFFSVSFSPVTYHPISLFYQFYSMVILSSPHRITQLVQKE